MLSRINEDHVVTENWDVGGQPWNWWCFPACTAMSASWSENMHTMQVETSLVFVLIFTYNIDPKFDNIIQFDVCNNYMIGIT